MPYTPQTWVANTTPVTAAKMNYIEAGIAAVDSAVAGAELGYDQITANVAIGSSSTTVISCVPHTFDGGPVLAHFFCPGARPSAAGGTLVVSIWEGATQVAAIDGFVGAGIYVPLSGFVRFSPSAGSHTYTVKATDSGGDGQMLAATGGATYAPTFIRFTKVEGSASVAGGIAQIADVTLGSTAANINFTSIPQTFAALRLIVHSRSDVALEYLMLMMRLNGDTGANYTYNLLNYNNGSGGTFNVDMTTAALAWTQGASASSNGFGVVEVVIPNYRSAFRKAFTSFGGTIYPTATGSVTTMCSGQWNNLGAINQVTVYPTSGSFVTGTRATLYGMI